MTYRMQYQGPIPDTSRGPSPILWADCPVLDIINDPDVGTYFFDEFLSFGGTVTSNVGTYSGQMGSYISYEDSGDSIAQLATEKKGGVIRLTTDTTDNDEVWMMPGGAASVFGAISDTAGDDYKLWFECRVRPGLITTGNWFVGMSEEGLAAADTITDAGAMASKDFIGFRQLEDDADGLDVVYRKAGQTEQEVEAVAETLVAATWYKLGFLYNPSEIDVAKKIKFFIDGEDIGSYVSATNIAAATFPDAEELHWLVGIKNSTSALCTLDVDWVRIAQYHGG